MTLTIRKIARLSRKENMATIKERLNNTNGWQRIYIAIVIFGTAIAIGNIYTEIQYGRLASKFLEIIGTLVGTLSLLY